MLSRTNRQELLLGEQVPLSPNEWDTGWGGGDPWGTHYLMLSCAILPAPALPLLSQRLSPWKLERVQRWEAGWGIASL